MKSRQVNRHWVQNNSCKDAQGLSENYEELYGSYKELTGSYTSMKKDIDANNKSQEEMKNTI